MSSISGRFLVIKYFNGFQQDSSCKGCWGITTSAVACRTINMLIGRGVWSEIVLGHQETVISLSIVPLLIDQAANIHFNDLQ